MNRFEEVVGEIDYLFEHGHPKEQRYPKAVQIKMDEIVLTGSRARGAGYRVRKRLEDKYKIIHVRDPGQTIKESEDPTLLFLDMKNFSEIPESVRELANTRENIGLLVVDVKDECEKRPNTYQINVDGFLGAFEKDIDPAISRMVAELYLNVDYAVDEESAKFLDGSVVKPYFRTSSLIEYDRSRAILEGILSSVVMKFDPAVIASREVTGKPPEDDVRMFELAEPLAKRLGIESAKIKKNGDKYSVEGRVYRKRVLLLKDVVGKGNTTLKLIDALKQEQAHIAGCVVLFDRNEGASRMLDRHRINLYSVTDLDMYQLVAAQKKMFDFVPVSQRKK